MKIRSIQPTDYPAVAQLVREAFQQSEHGYQREVAIVTNIRQEPSYHPELEVVALDEQNDELLGHGLLSEVAIVNETMSFTGLVLAPLAVAPTAQNQGVGGQLLKELEKRAKELDYPFISILGHPDYYPRFGYVPASRFQIEAPFPVPDEAFLIKEITPGGLAGVSGMVHYSKAFE